MTCTQVPFVIRALLLFAYNCLENKMLVCEADNSLSCRHK